MTTGRKILGSCLILAALFAHTAHAQVKIGVDVGPVGGPAFDLAPDVPVPATSSIQLDFFDNKTLIAGPGTTGFLFRGILGGDDFIPYNGVLLDANGEEIPGTEFSGVNNADAAEIVFQEQTVWSSILFKDGAFTAGPHLLLWVAGNPVVGEPPTGTQPPVADANGPYTGTAGTAVSFDGTGSSPEGEIASYTWEFGDGTTGSGVTPSHAYASAGNYNVTLTVTDTNGTSDSDSSTAEIGSASAPPMADAGGPYEGTAGEIVTFDGTGSSDPDDDIASYDWDFGDGNSGSGPMPTHTYATDGQYTVTLTVTDTTSETAFDTTTAVIATGNLPPSADAGAPVTGVVGAAVSFDGSGSTDPDGNIATYDWDFGDGNTGTGESPSHTYDTANIYTVTLTVTDDGGTSNSSFTTADIAENNQPPVADANGPYTGAVGVAVDFDGTGSSDQDGTILAHVWDFGDGNTGVGETVSHAYAAAGEYEVVLIVIDEDGGIAEDVTTATIGSDNQPPVADANGPYAGLVDAPVGFDGTASDDPDGDIETYVWDFGDGTFGSVAQPQHTYLETGVYDVTLTVTDNEGGTDVSVTKAIIGDGNLPPVADAGGPYRGRAGSAVTLDGSASDDPDGDITTYEWDFGDGTMGGSETIDHVFNEPGYYHVTLTVTDDDGAKSSDSTVVRIGTTSVPPLADAGGPYTGTPGAIVNWDGTGSDDPDGEIASWAWEFGNGVSSGGPTPKYAYPAPGAYIVRMTVTDYTGETDTDVTTALIGEGNLPPIADAGGPYVGAAGVAKQFDGTGSTALGNDIVTYEWAFGDGGTGTGASPLYTYGAAGTYSVTLTVTDENGISDSDSATALIGEPDPPPDDRLIDVVTLGNVGGGADADLAVLDVGLANGDQVSNVIHVRDGGTGEEIYQVQLPEIWRSLALETVEGFSGPLLAVLQRNASGDIRVHFRNAVDGTFASNIPYFDNTWTAIDLLAVRDAGGPGVPGIGVLAENPAGQQAIEVHKVGNGELVNQVFYFNDVWSASDAIDLGEFNGNGYSEMAVLATNNAGKHAVETRDTFSAKQISRYFYLGPTNIVIGAADTADVSGNSRPEIVVLGNKDATDNTANTIQAKDVKTGELVSKVGTYGPDLTGFGIRSIGDVDGNSFGEVVVAVLNNTDNTTSVSVRDIASNSLTNKTGFLGPAYDPRDVEVLGDVSGNSIQEVVVAGLNGDTLVIRVQLRDALEGTLLRNIDIN